MSKLYPQKSTVYIIDANDELTQTLALTLQKAGYNARPHSNAENFLNDYTGKSNSCLLLDMSMTNMSGTKLQPDLLACHINIPIISMSSCCDAPLIVTTIKKGAIDFLIKPIDDKILLTTINKALEQDRIRQQKLEHDNEVLKCADSLTKREIEVMRLIVEGELTKTIAADLYISTNTVENHRAKIMKKMKTHSIAELVSLCILHGLIEPKD